VLDRFLPREEFGVLRDEVRNFVDNTTVPPAQKQGMGYGEPIPFSNGYDHHDGNTLNRFFELRATDLPHATAFVGKPRTRDLVRLSATMRPQTKQFWLQQVVHGDDSEDPDVQKTLHKDTFHSVVKVWFFLHQVSASGGPLEYVHGSHRMSRRRYQWEHARAIAASKPGANATGSFRVTDDQLKKMGFGAPTPCVVEENTLVIADTRGFHRTGHDKPGTERLAIYGSLRPDPFDLVVR